MASFPLLPLDVWTSQITQASIPANQNALRVEVMAGLVKEFANDVDSTLEEGDIFIVDSSPSGDFATFTPGNLVIFKSGTFYEFEPYESLKKDVTTPGTTYIFSGGIWIISASGASDQVKARKVSATFDGGGIELTAGAFTYIEIPYNFDIESYTLLADVAGNAVLEVEYCDLFGFPSFSSITASDKPELVISQKRNLNIEALWTDLEFNAGDIFKITLQSVDTITKLYLSITGKTRD